MLHKFPKLILIPTKSFSIHRKHNWHLQLYLYSSCKVGVKFFMFFFLFKAIYYRDQVQTDFCEYQVNFMGEFLNYEESLERCTNNSGTLATIRNIKQLEALENIARRVYDYVYVSIFSFLYYSTFYTVKTNKLLMHKSKLLKFNHFSLFYTY